MNTDARHYGNDMDIEEYEAADLIVERDADIIRIEALGGDPDDSYGLGRPGVSLQVTPEHALTLAFSILSAIDPQVVADIAESLDYHCEDLGYRLSAGVDFGEEDRPEIEAEMERLAVLVAAAR